MSSFRDFQRMRRGEVVAPALAHAAGYAYDGGRPSHAITSAQAALLDRERECPCHTASPCGLGGGGCGGDAPLVSVICPTTAARHAYHGILLRCFRAQRYNGRLELVVYDTDGSRSPTFTEIDDPRVRYFHEEAHVPLGAKRRFLVDAARGAYVAHFDDDNVYGPAFIEVMLPHVLGTGADLASLSGWFSYASGTGALSRVPFRAGTGRAETFVHGRRLPVVDGDGDGDRIVPFPPVDKGEDGCASRVVSHDVDDDRGIFLHVEQGSNTCPIASTSVPLRAAGRSDLDPETAALLDALAPALARARRGRRKVLRS